MSVLDALVAQGWPRAALTLEDWEALPDDGEFRLECVEGVVVFMASPGRAHALAQSELTFVLRRAPRAPVRHLRRARAAPTGS